MAAVFCLFGFFSSAQPNYEQFENDQFRIKYRLWTVDDGLPHWRIRSMFTDSKGYLWILNYNYLSRFDGQSFEIMDTINVGRRRPYITTQSIAEDANGNIWYNCLETIKVLNPHKHIVQSIDSYTGSQGFLKNVDRHTKVYTVDGAVFIYSPTKGKVWHYDDELTLVLNGLVTNKEKGAIDFHCLPGPNNSWWFTNGNELELLDKQGKSIKHFEDVFDSGNMLFYSDYQVYTHNPSDVQEELPMFKSVLNGDQKSHIDGEIFPLLEQRDATYRSLNFLPELNTALLSAPNGEPQLYDYNKNEVIAMGKMLNLDLTQKPHYQGIILPPISMGNGVFMLNMPSLPGFLQIEVMPKRFESIAKGKSVHQLAFKDDETLLVLIKSGLYEVNLRSNVSKKVDITGPILNGKDTANLKPRSLYTRNGSTYLMFERFKGFIQLDKDYRQRFVWLETSVDTRAKTLKTLLVLSDEEILYATNKEIIKVNLKINTTEVLKSFSAEHNLKDLHKDKSGEIWAVTNFGLYHLKTDSTYLPFLNGKRNKAHRIYESPDGNFWFSTLDGLCKWKPFSKAFTLFTRNNGFISDELYAVLPDSLGRLWLSSNKGIIAFDTASLSCVNYTKSDGIIGNDYNSRAYAVSPNGHLYFGSIKGVTAFDPNAIEKKLNIELPDLSLVKVEQLNNRGEPIAEVIPYSEKKARLNIDRSCIQMVLHLSMPYFKNKELSYAWRIESISPQWTEFNLEQGLTISGMPSGVYNVEVRVSEKTNPQFSNIYHFEFKKGLYIYQLLWFKIVAMILLACSVFIVMRYRVVKLNQRTQILEEEIAVRTAKLKIQNETIASQNQSLERVDAAKSQLFNNISHEFRTPLTIIKGQVELVEQKLGNKHDSIKDLKQINVQANQITKLLDEVMNLSKLQMGKFVNTPETIEWRNFIKRVFAMFDGLARKKQLEFTLDLVPNEPILFRVDVQKIEHVLVNLIGNAIKFTPDVGRIVVRCEFKDGVMKVEVIDNGPGIAIEEQNTIFERYQQGKSSGNIAEPGYGIGLALCKEYIELIDGKLWVESALGEGASFMLEFPVVEVSQEELQNETVLNKSTIKDSETIDKDDFTSASSGHLLIVEDNPELLNYLNQLLGENYAVSTAINGQLAWEMLKIDDSIDLVLSDAMMPVMDGFTLLQKTRTHAQLGFMPFILLTALADDDERLKGLRIGVDAYVIKPFDSQELLLRISNLISRQQKRKAGVASVKAKQTSNDVESVDELISYDEAWLMEVEAVVKKNVSDSNFKLPDLAFILHASERTLFNKLKSYTGLTPSEYIRKSRLDLAMHYIKARKFATVKELSASVGIINTAHFATIFKKEFGATPKELLK